MNKQEVLAEYRGILSLVKTLVSAYSKKEVNIYVYAEEGENIKDVADRMEQHLNFLSEFGEITTIQREGNKKFVVGIGMGMLVFYQNFFDDIEYVLDQGELSKGNNYDLGCMLRLRRMFKVAKDNHCSVCCDEGDE